MVEATRSYILFGVDATGVARATYEFNCRDDEEAKGRAQDHLQQHEAVELWIDHRRVAKLQRNAEPGLANSIEKGV